MLARGPALPCLQLACFLFSQAGSRGGASHRDGGGQEGRAFQLVVGRRAEQAALRSDCGEATWGS